MYAVCGKANSGKQLPSQDVHSVANPLAIERMTVISRCTQQRSRHAKRTTASTRCTQYVARQTGGNNCHHKMYTVLQIHWQSREWLSSQDVRSNAAGMRKEQLPSQDVRSMCQGKQWETTAITRCTQCCKSTDKQENSCHLKMYAATQQACEKNDCHRKMYTVCIKGNNGKQLPAPDVHSVANPSARERQLPSQDVRSNAAGMRKERLPSQDIRSMRQGKQWETAAITRCTQCCKFTGNRDNGCHPKMYQATQQACKKNSYRRKMYAVCVKANSGNSCHHKMYTVLQVHVLAPQGLLTDKKEDPEPANLNEARRSIWFCPVSVTLPVVRVLSGRGRSLALGALVNAVSQL